MSTETSANKPETSPQEGADQPSRATDDAAQSSEFREDSTIKFEDAASAAPTDPTLEWKSRVTYLSAEIDNMRKRFAREKGDVIRFAGEEVLRKILPVFDNLERALKAAKEGESKLDAAFREHPVFSGLLKGLEMTLKHFDQTLEGAGVQPVKSVGENFDPTLHEAIGQSQIVDKKDNEITGEMQKGFQLNGRVIRPARVVVNKL